MRTVAQEKLSWHSSHPNFASVSDSGTVTLHNWSSSEEITISARDTNYIYRYKFKIANWFEPGSKDNFQNAKAYCQQNDSRLPSLQELTKGASIRDVGALYSEWGTPKGWNIDNSYWSANTYTSGETTMQLVVHLTTGDSGFSSPTDQSSKANIVCIYDEI